ncbi:hypothetical protein EJ03DRAFT_328263 [Teratosphaeria nubilosa]|uniref:Uncharacterized protein n=1 Tax=Teratosphaeria nubilosa TaxID=161662 RepID=A0A6G1L842_9PEZI|nr:hypothetical protein EJ03DRAFT_328263 [Teratosphaeria nubilosa]
MKDRREYKASSAINYHSLDYRSHHCELTVLNDAHRSTPSQHRLAQTLSKHRRNNNGDCSSRSTPPQPPSPAVRTSREMHQYRTETTSQRATLLSRGPLRRKADSERKNPACQFSNNMVRYAAPRTRSLSANTVSIVSTFRRRLQRVANAIIVRARTHLPVTCPVPTGIVARAWIRTMVGIATAIRSASVFNFFRSGELGAWRGPRRGGVA